jgi:hypothetical protein
MYNPYDFRPFIDSVKEMDYLDIIKAAERRCYELESISYGQKGAVRAREMGSTRLAEQLKGLLFWLRTMQKPLGLSDGDFASLRVICDNLVRKQQFKPEALDIFANQEP